MAVPFCTSTSNKGEFPLLCILTSNWYFQFCGFEPCVQWYLIAILIYNSLMTDDVRHMFICLFALFVFSLVMSIHIPCPFLNSVVCFHIVEFNKVLYIYIGDSSLFVLATTSDICFKNIFSLSVDGLPFNFL